MKTLATHIARIKAGYAGKFTGRRVRDSRGRFFYCEDCENAGLVDVGIGGGNTRREFCRCQVGDRRREQTEAEESRE